MNETHTAREINALSEQIRQLKMENAHYRQVADMVMENENNLRAFFNTIDHLLFVLDMQGNIILTNDTVTRKLGFSFDELDGQNVLMVHPPERRTEAGRIVGEMLAGSADYCPVPVITKDGRQIPVETRVVAGKWSGQDVIFGVTKDLSDIKASEEKFSKAFHTVPSLMAISEVETGRYVDVNEAFLQTLGYERDEVIGKTSFELHLFHDAEERTGLLNRMSVEGSLRNMDVVVYDKLGQIHHGTFSAEYIQLQDRKLLLTVMNDMTARMQAEENLRLSEARYRHVSSIISDVAYSCMADEAGDYGIDWLSGAVEQITGYTEDQLKDIKCWGNLVLEEDFPIFAEKIRDLSPGETGECELRIRRQNGELRWISSNAKCVTEDSRLRLYGGLTDITKRKQIETELIESEVLYHTLFEQSPDGIIILNPETAQPLNFNEQACRQLGYAREEFAALTLKDIEVIETLEESLAYMKIVSNGRNDFETRHRTKEGEIRDVFVSAQLIEVAGHAIYHCVWRDITEQKRTEATLRESEAQTRAIINSVPDLLFRIDRHGLILDFHAPENSALYVPPAVFLNKSVQNVLPPQIARSAMDAIEKALNGTPMVLFEYDLEVNNETRYYEDRIVPLNSGQALSVIRDITERKRAEIELRENRKFLADLIEHSTTLIFVKDRNGRYELVNQRYEEVTGLQREALIGRTDFECFPAEDAARFQTSDLQVIQSGKGVEIEDYINSPKGRQYLLTVKFPLHTNDGSMRGICGIVTDITERKQTERALRESEEKYRSVVNTLSEGILLQDKNGNILACNQAAEKILDLKKDVYDKISFSSLQIINEDGSPAPNASHPSMQAVRAGHVMQGMVMGLKRANEQLSWLSINSRPVKNADEDRVEYVVSSFTDITERKNAEDALRENELRYRIVADNTHDWEFWQAPDGQFLYNSPSCKSITGYQADEFMGDHYLLMRIIYPDDVAGFMAHQEEVNNTKESGEHEFRIVLPNGCIRWIEHVCQPVFDAHGNYLGIRGSNRDVTRRKYAEIELAGANEQMQLQVKEIMQLQTELREQALRDPLTNLYNRRYLDEAMERDLARMKREKGVLSVIMLDIDHFKNINDTYGHTIGDQFLTAIANLLKKQTRGSDIACRYGGEEFLIVLPDTTAKAALSRAEEIREQCAKLRIRHEKQKLSITISLGVALYPSHGRQVEGILKKADQAMYKSKQNGRNRVTLWDKTIKAAHTSTKKLPTLASE